MPNWRITWTPPPEFNADKYRVYLDKDPAEDGLDPLYYGQTTANFMMVTMASVQTKHVVYVAPVVNGVEADEEDWSSVEVTPNSTADFNIPDNVSGFACAQSDDKVTCEFDRITDDPLLDAYVIRRGDSWDSGVEVWRSSQHASGGNWLWAASGSKTFWIKAKNRYGLYSATAQSSVVVIEQLGSEVQQGSDYDEHTGGFSGTMDGVETTVGGDLRPEAYPTDYTLWTTPADYADAVNSPWWWPYEQGGSYETAAVDVGQIVVEKIECDIAGTITEEAMADYNDWVAPQYESEVVDELDGSGEDIARSLNQPDEFSYMRYMPGPSLALLNPMELLIEINTAQDGVPTWDGWRKWLPGAYYRYRQVKLRITYVLVSPFWYPLLTGFLWRRWRRNWKDEGLVTGNSSPNWKSVTFAAPFSAGSTPVITAVVHNSAVRQVEFQNVTNTGFDFRVYNSSGTQVAEEINWVAAGV